MTTWAVPQELADSIVPDQFIFNSVIRDNMLFLKYRNITRNTDYDGTVISTTSITYVSITGSLTNFSISSGSTVLIFVNLTMTPNNTGSASPICTFKIDGVDQIPGGFLRLFTTGFAQSVGVVYEKAGLAAGAHTFEMFISSSDGVQTQTVHQFAIHILEV
jgi:hypothetical protein